jgi:hypothetical protein
METLIYSDVHDRSDWPSGPWDTEPDKVQWPDSDTGLPCLAVRNSSGAWCGYVGCPEDHPLHGMGYDDVYAAGHDIEVHGGLTFAGPCTPGTAPGKGICHIPGEGESDNVWWLGFDCAHYRDLMPAMSSMFQDEGIYRDWDYVKSECANLTRQIAQATS